MGRRVVPTLPEAHRRRNGRGKEEGMWVANVPDLQPRRYFDW